MIHRDLMTRANKTGFRGVYARPNGLFIASGKANITGYSVHIGYFKSAVLAAQAYDDWALTYKGPDARVNFPMNDEKQALALPLAEVLLCRNGHELSSSAVIRSGKVRCSACIREYAAKNRKDNTELVRLRSRASSKKYRERKRASAGMVE